MVFVFVVPPVVLRRFYVVEYATPDLLAYLGVTELNRWCDGSFGDEIRVRLTLGLVCAEEGEL